MQIIQFRESSNYRLDLVDEYCNVAKMLAKKVGPEHLVDYRQGDATNMPLIIIVLI